MRHRSGRNAPHRHRREIYLLGMLAAVPGSFLVAAHLRHHPISSAPPAHVELLAGLSPVPLAKIVSLVAQSRGPTISIFESPSDRVPTELLRNPTSSGEPLVFLVSDLSQAPKWLRVYLPQRPNGRQGWVLASAVTLASDNYVVNVHLAAHKLTVSDGNREVISVPIGEGRAVLPTPIGTYFIANLLKQPNAQGEYGPYAFGLSAFSNVLQSFGGGPGEIGIHGTNVPSSVGVSVSHGCIRVTDSTITELAHLLPLGTKVVIGP